MEKLYYQVPYVREFQAQVVSCLEGKNHRYEVELDRTGFYPEGGGQSADTGFLNGIRVLDVQEKNGTVIHYIENPILEGTQVTGVIDWDRRYENMQQHSGEHLLSGLIHQHFGFDNVGFHMGKEEITIDFNGVLTMEQLEKVEEEANDMIYENLPVLETWPSPEELKTISYRSKKELTGDVRIIEIPGGDICACCGTHVRTTGEIGLIKVLGMIHYKGGVRISMLCGKKAWKDYQKKQKQITSLSVLLSAKPEQVVEAVEKLKKENGVKDGIQNQLYQQLFTWKTDQLPESSHALCLWEEGLEPVQIRRLCTMLYERRKGSRVLVCSGTEGQYSYAMGSSTCDMRMLSKKMNGLLNGRGGGSVQMAQGTFFAEKEKIEEVWKSEEGADGFK